MCGASQHRLGPWPSAAGGSPSPKQACALLQARVPTGQAADIVLPAKDGGSGGEGEGGTVFHIPGKTSPHSPWALP